MSRPNDPSRVPTALPDNDAPNAPDRRRFVVRRNPQQRLDQYLRQRLKNISRHQVQKLIGLGGVAVNGRQAKASGTVHQGDVLDVILPPPPVQYLQPEPIDLDVVYEDEHFIVVNKQADLVVHPARSHLSGTLLNALAHHFTQTPDGNPPTERGRSQVDAATSSAVDSRSSALSSVGEDQCRPGIVHRLDKNTTGLIVVAKSDTAHWKIARKFENRSLLKSYLAVVHGQVELAGGVVDEPIGKHPTIREAYAVRHDSAGKPSVTLYRVRERYRGYTLVELELKTGRTHQIRVHMSYLGHPVTGDIVYGGDPISWQDLDAPPRPAGTHRFTTFARTKDEGHKIESQADERSDLIVRYPMLHAALLRFDHPITKQLMTFTAPLHEPMATLIHELRQRPTEGAVAPEGYCVNLQKVLSSGPTEHLIQNPKDSTSN